MKKNIVIILDPAHGADVKGKRSPDGKHREYRWSRDRIADIKTILTSMGYEVYVTTESENEPGLSKRKNFATQVRPGARKLLLSLHNDASGDGTKWMDANGFSVWTTKGVTDADRCADIILERFRKNFPDIKIREYVKSELNKDFEANFTVLMGSGYMGVLIEWLFQDNKTDVERLMDVTINKRFEDSLVDAIEEINDYFSK